MSFAFSPEVLQSTTHRPYPLPSGPWRLRQRWRDLLFAHYPVPPATVAPLLPPGLELDTYDGAAWLGVVPFWMDHVESRTVGSLAVGVPTVRAFNELNLRTYVRSPRTGLSGVYFFALDCSSALATLGARVLFHLPYFPALMSRSITGNVTDYRSRRILCQPAPRFEASFGPAAPVVPSTAGSLPAFLTERYCLFTSSRGRILRGDIHHLPWPLQAAEAEIRIDELPEAHGMRLGADVPVLHFARSLEVYLWGLEPDVRVS